MIVRRHLSGLDLVLLVGALALSVLGVMLVWSATAGDLGTGGALRQGLGLTIGLVLCLALSRAPFHTFRVIAPWWYVAGVLLVLLTLTPLGTTVAGARAWLALPGGFTLQPSEFAKIGLILILAAIGSAGVVVTGRDRAVAHALLVAAVPIVLVLLQNDTGTLLVMAAFSLAVIVVAGTPVRWIMALLGGGLAVAVAVLQFGLLQSYQVERLTSFMDPEADGLGAGYNALQARIAIGGGGLFGQGLFQGVQTQGSFVPVNESDFIFTVAAEELGLLGAVAVIGLIGVVLWRGMRIAVQADDMFSRLVATGITAWFGFQAFENIGMNLGIMPVTGVTLPFVSFGGSSLIACWIAVGVLQVLHLRQRRGVLARGPIRSQVRLTIKDR